MSAKPNPIEQRLAEVRLALAKIDADNAAQKKLMENDPNITILGQKMKDADEAAEAAMKAYRVVTDRARARVLIPGARVVSSRSDNIREDVMPVVRRHVNLSLLADSVVEGMIEDVIRMLAESDPAYKAVREERDRTGAAKSQAASEYYHYTDKYSYKGDYKLREELKRLEKLVSNPASLKAAERRLSEKELLPEKTKAIFEELQAAAQAPSPSKAPACSLQEEARGE